MTPSNSFNVPTTEEGANVSIEVFANDAAGNRSSIESSTVTVEGDATELTEEELEEAEEADREDNNPPQTIRFRNDPNSEKSFGLLVDRGDFKCEYRGDYPHISEHAKPLIRINAVSWIECNVPGATGWVASSLMRKGPYGSYPVKTSGNSPIVDSLKRTYARAPINCSSGKFYTRGSFHVIPPPSLKTIGTSNRTFASKVRTINC